MHINTYVYKCVGIVVCDYKFIQGKRNVLTNTCLHEFIYICKNIYLFVDFFPVTTNIHLHTYLKQDKRKQILE